MIAILGIRRIVTLAGLLLVNGALVVLAFYILAPQKQKAEQELQVTRSAVETRRGEITTLKTEYEQIQEQKNLFGNLQKTGFFQGQDRVSARRTIEQIQGSSGILAARYDIQAARAVENPALENTDHVLLFSAMKVSLDALSDVDVYNFIYWIENAFPGHAGVTEMTIERKLDVDETTLKQIGNRVPTVLVNADVTFGWNTMVPRAQLPQQLVPDAIPQ